MNKVVNSQHIKLYLRMKQQEFGIDKSLSIFIDNAKSHLENWKSIKRDIEQFSCERRKIEEPLTETIIDIYQDLKSVKEMLTPTSVETIDLEIFKKKLKLLWKKIEELKSSHNDIESLVSEQKNLNAEVDELSRKIHKHENFNSNDNFYSRIVNVKAMLQKQDSTNKDVPDEVDNFFALISSSGHTGGWSEKDHALFVKLRKRLKNTEALVSALRTKCPDLSEENISKHDAWYVMYLNLREKQKVALQEWRERREAERRSREKADDDANGNKPEVKKNIPINKESIAKRNEAAMERRKKLLNKLKERQKPATEVSAPRNDQDKAKRAFWDIQRQARIVEIRKRPSEEQERKSQYRKLENHQVVVKSHRPTFKSSLFLQLYRARDQQYLEKRIKILSKTNPQNQSIPQLQNNRTSESTLIKKTEAWQEKLKNEPCNATRAVFCIKDVPKLEKSNQIINRYL